VKSKWALQKVKLSDTEEKLEKLPWNEAEKDKGLK
jgi:hypothetical protein